MRWNHLAIRFARVLVEYYFLCRPPQHTQPVFSRRFLQELLPEPPSSKCQKFLTVTHSRVCILFCFQPPFPNSKISHHLGFQFIWQKSEDLAAQGLPAHLEPSSGHPFYLGCVPPNLFHFSLLQHLPPRPSLDLVVTGLGGEGGAVGRREEGGERRKEGGGRRE